MMVRHFIDHGHKAVLLLGGATGLIGDPDGKDEERSLKTPEEVAANKAGIAEQYRKVFAGKPFDIVDNYDWFKGMGYLEFLRDVGKHVPMRQMLGRDFVQTRLAEGGTGISYAEFSYVLIQGYDFLHLYNEKGVTLQVCGSDQWGNSIAGVDLIRRITGGEAHVWSTPLVINKATGKKFGKTEGGAVWLEAELTSAYKFYQFWLNADDEGVEDYLKIFTLLDKPKIEQVMNDFNENRSSRNAQKTLAFEVTKLVHGEDQAHKQVKIAEILFGGGDHSSLTEEDYEILGKELPVVTVNDHDDVVPVLVEGGLASSNSEARRLLSEGAIYVDGERAPTGSTSGEIFYKHGPRFGNIRTVRRGKNIYMLVKVS